MEQHRGDGCDPNHPWKKKSLCGDDAQSAISLLEKIKIPKVSAGCLHGDSRVSIRPDPRHSQRE